MICRRRLLFGGIALQAQAFGLTAAEIPYTSLDFVANRYRHGDRVFGEFEDFLLATDGRFTRASSKLTYNRMGKMQVFSRDEPAISSGGLVFEAAAENVLPFTDDLSLGWDLSRTGTGASTIEIPLAPLVSVFRAPDGYNSERGRGITCTGLCWDERRNRFLIGNDGRRLDAQKGYAAWHTSIVQLDGSLRRTGEWSVTWPGEHANGRGLQGIAIDTRDDVVACVVPSLPIIGIFDPLTFRPLRAIQLSTIRNPNGIAYDSLRDGFWISDNSDQTIRFIGKKPGISLLYKPPPTEWPGLDHLCYLPHSDELLFTFGDNQQDGQLRAVSLEHMRTMRAARLVEAKAIEGVAVRDDSIFVCSDGYFHSVAPGNVKPPYDVNVILRYPYEALAIWRDNRLTPFSGSYAGLMQGATRLQLNKGAGGLETDTCMIKTAAIATGGPSHYTFSFDAWSADGESYTMLMQMDSAWKKVHIGPRPTTHLITAYAAPGSVVQIGLTGGAEERSTDNYADVVIAGAQMEEGRARTSWIATSQKKIERRSSDTLVLEMIFRRQDIKVVFDDGSEQWIRSIPSGPFKLDASFLRRRIIRQVNITRSI